MLSKAKTSILGLIFSLILLGLTIFLIGVGYWLWEVTKTQRYTDLAHTTSVLERYYEITFYQRELGLRSIGERILDIDGENKEERRLDFAKKSLKSYNELLAFGLAAPNGQLLTFTGEKIGDTLPNLMDSDKSRRSFLEAKSAKGIVIGEVYFFKNLRTWLLPIRVPIRDTLGQLVAVNTSGIEYKNLNKELKSFDFHKLYRIHLVNAGFQSTQIYYPLNRASYSQLLAKSSDIYDDMTILKEKDNLLFFEGYNSFEKTHNIGIKTKAGKLNHYLVVSVDKNILYTTFWSSFRFILLVYFLLGILAFLAFKYYQNKDKEYKQHLQTERDYSHKIIQESPSLVVGISTDQTCKFVNPITQKTIGYSKEEIVGKNWWNLVYPGEAYHQVEALFKEIEKKGNVRNYEMTLITKNGEERIISWNSINFYTNGILTEIVGFGSDITEKKSAEVKLLERQANLDSLIENTSNIIGLFDKKLRLVEYNSAFVAYAKATDNIDLYPNMPILEKISPTHARLFRRLLNRALKGEKLQEVVEYTANQTTLYFMISYNPIIQNETVTGVSMFVQDITELKKIQNDLKTYSENLEYLVKERTQDLETINEELTTSNEELSARRTELEQTLYNLHKTQEQLVKAEKMASLGTLAAGVGHEINNPLNFISGGVEGLEVLLNELSILDSTDAKTYIDIIQEGVRRATGIVKSLSHFSRQGGAQTEICSIHQILDNCLLILQNLTKHKIEIIKNYTSSKAIVMGNEGKIHQALLNILSNAVQAIESQGTISLKTSLSEETIQISIGDTGTGISKENLLKISDPFFTTKAPGKGTGLGLSITYKIIEEHQGSIEVSSELGIGTTFIITLPTHKINGK